jgi:hypothetical protein
MKDAIGIAKDNNIGHVYVTDDYMTGEWINPWDSLPSYWDKELQQISCD